MTQGALGFPTSPSYRSEDFIISSSNEEAWRWVMSWPEWPSHAFYLYGPPDSGKTHLAHLWRDKVSGSFLSPQNIQKYIENNESFPIIMELEPVNPDEENLFHLLNATRQHNTPLLLIHSKPALRTDFQLPDLLSRLKALPSAGLLPPDDTLMRALLIKMFSDRQLLVPDEAVEYLVRRLERSFSILHHIVCRLDEESMRQKQRITIPFIKKNLELK